MTARYSSTGNFTIFFSFFEKRGHYFWQITETANILTKALTAAEHILQDLVQQKILFR